MILLVSIFHKYIGFFIFIVGVYMCMCVYVCVCVCVCVCVSFIYSLTDGHLGWLAYVDVFKRSEEEFSTIFHKRYCRFFDPLSLQYQ